MCDVKYPTIVVDLDAVDGNAFAIMGAVRKALRKNSVDAAEIQTFLNEAKSGNYDHLLDTCDRWVTIE
jgi:hypothetical protein